MTLRRNVLMGFVVTAVMAFFGTAEVAHAALYGYSVQLTSNYTFTGSGLTVGPIFPLSSSSAAQNTGATPPGADAHAGTLDVLQSYVGPGGGKPPENSFGPKGLTTPDYSRGDALITAAPAAFSTNNVAELYLASPFGTAAGAGSWSVSASLTLSATGTITLGFDYTNLLTVINSTPGGSVQADYSYVWTIRDSSGAVVFSASPTAVNQSVSLTAPGSISTPGAGTVSIVSIALAPGTYTGTISGTENVFATAVPEPTTLTLLAMGGAGLFGFRYRRTRRG